MGGRRYFSAGFLQKLKELLVDIVIANPDFSGAIPTLALAGVVLKTRGEAWVVLPSSYFETSAKRLSWFKTQPLKITQEVRLGCLCYRTDTNRPKRTPDFIFVIRKLTAPQFTQHCTFQTTLVDVEKLTSQ